jgi:hypothetical protein
MGVFQPAHFVMERKMMRRLKVLAEKQWSMTAAHVW